MLLSTMFEQIHKQFLILLKQGELKVNHTKTWNVHYSKTSSTITTNDGRSYPIKE